MRALRPDRVLHRRPRLPTGRAELQGGGVGNPSQYVLKREVMLMSPAPLKKIKMAILIPIITLLMIIGMSIPKPKPSFAQRDVWEDAEKRIHEAILVIHHELNAATGEYPVSQNLKDAISSLKMDVRFLAGGANTNHHISPPDISLIIRTCDRIDRLKPEYEKRRTETKAQVDIFEEKRKTAETVKKRLKVRRFNESMYAQLSFAYQTLTGLLPGHVGYASSLSDYSTGIIQMLLSEGINSPKGMTAHFFHEHMKEINSRMEKWFMEHCRLYGSDYYAPWHQKGRDFNVDCSRKDAFSLFSKVELFRERYARALLYEIEVIAEQKEKEYENKIKQLRATLTA